MTLPISASGERGGRWLDALRWSAAAIAMVAVHASAAFFVSQIPPPVAPPQGAPDAAVLIDLAPPAPPPSAPTADAPPTEAPPEEALPEPQPEPTPEPTPEPVALPPEPVPPEPAPPELAPPEPVAEPEPPVPEPVVEPEPQPEPPPPEPMVEPEPLPELPKMEAPPEVAANAPVPLPRPTPPERPRVVEKAQERKAAPKPRRERPREEAKPRAQKPRAAPPPSRAAQTSNAPSTQGAAPRSDVSPARWQGQIQARLNRFKRTPRGGGQGLVTVSFTITGSGAASGIRLARSSGNPVLDQAALDLVRRASPFPAPPSGGSVPITVPINYTR